MSHVLLWSQRQNALHVEPVDRMLENNMRAYRDNRATDYVALLIADKATVEATAESIRGTIVQRAHARRERVMEGF